MLRSCRDTYIGYINSLVDDLGKTISDGVAYGNCNLLAKFKTLSTVSAYVRILSCVPSITFLHQITLNSSLQDAYNLTLTIGSGTFTFTINLGNGDSSVTSSVTYAIWWVATFNALNYPFQAVISDSNPYIIYVYNYTHLVDDTVAVGGTVYSSDASVTDSTIVSTITALNWAECLTESEICDIINHAINIMENSSQTYITCSTC